MCDRINVIKATSASFGCFSLFFTCLRCLPSEPTKNRLFCQWMLCFAHASLIVLLCGDIIMQPETKLNSDNQEDQCVVLSISLGYLFYDIFNEITTLLNLLKKENMKEATKTITFLIHHSLVISLLIMVFKFGFGATEMCYLLCFYEISSIFLSIRGALIAINLKNYWLTNITTILWFITFTLFRMLIGPYIIFYSLYYTRFNDKGILFKLFVLSFHLLNCYWFYIVITKLTKRKIKKESSDE